MKEPVIQPFIFEERINIGGMAEVWKVRRRGESPLRFYALKTLRSELAKDPAFLDMFFREAEISMQLQHTNICRSFEIGEGDNQFYILMEYIDGIELNTIFAHARKLKESIPIELACHIVIELCKGLEYVHQRRGEGGKLLSIVHRDISPQNVMISRAGEVKLIDFGIAKSAEKRLTLPGVIKGKYAYMSPEQLQGKELDLRSDIFSLGTVLWELTTMRYLFQAESKYESIERIFSGVYESPSLFVPNYPKILEEIIFCALRFRPQERYPDCRTMQVALEKFLDSLGYPFHRKGDSTLLATYMTHLLKRQAQDEQKETAEVVALLSGQKASSLSADETHTVNDSDIWSEESLGELAAPVYASALSMTKDTPPLFQQNWEEPDVLDDMLGVLEMEFSSMVPPQEEERLAGHTFDWLACPTSQRPRLLLLGQEGRLLELFSSLLSASGCRVTLASGLLESLDILSQEDVDLCLLDVDGENPDSLVRSLRRLRPSLPCVLMTSKTSLDLALLAGQEGALGYLVKPISEEELLGVIWDLVRYRPSWERFDFVLHPHLPACLGFSPPAFGKDGLSTLQRGWMSYVALLGWMGSLAFTMYLNEPNLFDPSLNRFFLERSGNLTPRHWLEILWKLQEKFQQENQVFFSRGIRSFLREPDASSSVLSTFTGLSREIRSRLKERAEEQGFLAALDLFERYEKKQLLLDVECQGEEFEAIARSLQLVRQSLLCEMYRVFDYRLGYVHQVEVHPLVGFRHILRVLSVVRVVEQVWIQAQPLKVGTLYLLSPGGEPLFSLFPFWAVGACEEAGGKRDEFCLLASLEKGKRPTYHCLESGLVLEADPPVAALVSELLERL